MIVHLVEPVYYVEVIPLSLVLCCTVLYGVVLSCSALQCITVHLMELVYYVEVSHLVEGATVLYCAVRYCTVL